MNIKDLAFSTQKRIAARIGVPFARSHVYEAFAAAAGFASYAALRSHSVFDADDPTDIETFQDTSSVVRRLRLLGLPEALAVNAAYETLAVVTKYQLRARRIERVIDRIWLNHKIEYGQEREYGFEADFGEFEEIDDDDVHGVRRGVSPFLCSSLLGSALTGNASAHYAVALLSGVNVPSGSAYWDEKRVDGEQLTGEQLEWANAHKEYSERERFRVHHLREAARAGHPDACLDMAVELNDAEFLTGLADWSVRNPASAWETAEDLGQSAQARKWCEQAAERGNMDAIREMIETYSKGDDERAWVWIHFAKSLGTDLTLDDYRLVNEDGSEYDDDAGGPGYPLGEGGVRVTALDEGQDAVARHEADVLLARLADRDRG